MVEICIVAPGDYCSGGPELLHQLGAQLRHFGHEASMLYYPFSEKFSCPQKYEKYGVPVKLVSEIEDMGSTTVILPETITGLSRRFPGSQIFIWWLSVDNYFGIHGYSKVKDVIRPLKWLFNGTRLPVSSMRTWRHVAQSEYAKHFLIRRRIKPSMLSDYLGAEHFDHGDNLQREDVVLFNPRKGMEKTRKLIAANPDIQFVPLEGLDAQALTHRLKTAKVYIDFGRHPGKDRMPREAAVAGCCVVTGRAGAAAFDVDLPIAREYKLNDAGRQYIDSFGSLVRSIFADFERHSSTFGSYRASIKTEEAVFKAQVRSIFGDRRRKPAP